MDELRNPDFPVRWVLVTILGAFVVLVLAIAVIHVTFPAARPADFAAPEDLGAPRLEIRPVEDYETWRGQQAALLDGGEGRTPISDAMARIAERGADAFAPLTDDGNEEARQ